jgi:hypothetical protein
VTRDAAVAALRVMVSSLDKSDFDVAVARLLERVSLRADSLELRAALTEQAAQAMLREAIRESGA